MEIKLKNAIIEQYAKSVESRIDVGDEVVFGWHIEDENGKLIGRSNFNEEELLEMYQEVTDYVA